MCACACVCACVCMCVHVCTLHSSAQILGVLELLVKYGYYDDPEDIVTLLEPLLTMLSGTNDVPGVSKCLCDACFILCCVHVWKGYK